MKNLRSSTMGILSRVESLSGRPIEFRPDSSLTLRATLQMARQGAPAHLLRYRTTNSIFDDHGFQEAVLKEMSDGVIEVIEQAGMA